MASAAPVTESSPVSEDSTIATLRNILVSDDESISRRYRALFSLKSPACQHPPTERTVPAIQAMAAAMTSSSELLKHEIGYCLGQTRHAAAVEYLQREVKNPEQALMCRHEAAEALGALGDVGSLDMLRALRDDMTQHVALRETCELSVNRIEWEKSDKAQTEKLRPSDFSSIDPAPPLPMAEKQPSVQDLRSQLIDECNDLFHRYRALFALRDVASPSNLPTAVPAVEALADALRMVKSALLRHEVAFVFGQLGHPASIPVLIEKLSDMNEVAMVRHEAAEALGDLGDEPGVIQVLEKYLHDPEPVVRESIFVALGMVELEQSGAKEYAIIPGVTE